MSTETKCSECGMVLAEIDEYHPGEFCVLITAGFDPWRFVIEAMQQVVPDRHSKDKQNTQQNS